MTVPLVPGRYPADGSHQANGGHMPICEIDPWRIQYFTHACCPAEVRIPTEDSDAWAWNPRHRWVYDRIAIARSQGMAAGTHGTLPPRFPVFSKPIVNLKGMGLGTRIVRSLEDYERHCIAGHMWMTLLTGRHVSSDVAVVGGNARWWRHVTARRAVARSTIGPSTRMRSLRWKRRSADGSPPIFVNTAAWSISKLSAARLSKYICGRVISGRTFTVTGGSTRWSTSIRVANGFSSTAGAETASASCCSVRWADDGDIRHRNGSRKYLRCPVSPASRSRFTRIATPLCMRCRRAVSGSPLSTAGTSRSGLRLAIGSAGGFRERFERGPSSQPQAYGRRRTASEVTDHCECRAAQ